MRRLSGYIRNSAGQLSGYTGRKALRFINHTLNILAFTYRILMLIVKRPKEGRAVDRWITIEQIYFTAVQALPVILPIALIVGSFLITIFATLSGQYDMGKMTVFIIIRELGPILTALIVILRSATAVTIEISYMNVFNEIDAIEMAGIDPMRILCIPRLVGITSAVLCLFIVFDLVSIIGGYGVVWITTFLPVDNLFEQIGKAITMSDIIVGLVKAIFFGITITILCLYHGFNTEKRITNVPQGTSRASVECFFYVLVINIIISVVFYL